MNKIIFTLCFILIALTGAASVCACDADNSTLEMNLNENTEENIELYTNNAQITQDNDDAQDSDDEKLNEWKIKTAQKIEKDINDENLDFIQIFHYKNDGGTLIIYSGLLFAQYSPEEQAKVLNLYSFIRDEFIKHKNELDPYVITDFTNHYLLSDRLDNVEELVESVSQQYGSANVTSMALNAGVSEGMILETIHEIKIGLHGQELKDLFAKKDAQNNFKLSKINKDIQLCEDVLNSLEGYLESLKNFN